MSEAIGAFLEASVRTATPLAIAALGETVSQRAGVINLGMEGALMAGAFGALVGAGAAGAGAGLLVAVASGAVVGVLFAVFSIWLRTDQIITGTALTMLALGATGTLYRTVYGARGAGLDTPTLDALSLPGFSSIPLVGQALFAQPLTTWLLYALVPLTWWWLYRTHHGLALRSVGESTEAAAAAGIPPRRTRALAVIVGSASGGFAGGALVLAQAGTFAEGMSAGRGFIAIAIVVLGRWHPAGALLGALLFGAAGALQYLFQAMGWSLPYQIFLALPYLLVLVLLAATRGGGGAPRELGT